MRRPRSYLQWDALLAPDEVAALSAIYDDILGGRYEAAKKHRYDLGSSVEQQRPDVENTTQVGAAAARWRPHSRVDKAQLATLF
jgi:hypothetical protein